MTQIHPPYSPTKLAASPSRKIHISRWINEPLPPSNQLLSAGDVARLTRRPRWLILGMIALRHFPRQWQYCGRPVGWLRSEIVAWLVCDFRQTGRLLTRRRGQSAQRDRLAEKVNSCGVAPYFPAGSRRGAPTPCRLVRRGTSICSNVAQALRR